VIQQFIDEIAKGAPVPWLRPLALALHSPGTALLPTMEGHSNLVSGVMVTADGERVVSASERQPIAGYGKGKLRMPKILVVDDDALRNLIKMRLAGTYEVIDTGDPVQALGLALEHRPDGILLDLMMPNTSGKIRILP
jgi:PleD family two-component response regulator